MKHSGTQQIDTPRLILRRFSQADAQDMFDTWANDPDVTRYLTWQPYGDISVTKNLLREWEAAYERDDIYSWAIVLKETNKPIGSLSAVAVNNHGNDLTVELGYCIAKKYWRRGITPEAAKAVIDYIFATTDCVRIEAVHDQRNPNSGKVMAKCGMRYEGTLRKRGKNNIGICDECMYAILRDDKQ